LDLLPVSRSFFVEYCTESEFDNPIGKKEAPHFDEIWRDWNEGKRETIYLCLEHAQELGLEW